MRRALTYRMLVQENNRSSKNNYKFDAHMTQGVVNSEQIVVKQITCTL